MKSKGLEKYQFVQHFSKLGKFVSTTYAYIKKNPLFLLFHELGKIENSSWSNIQKSQNLLIRKNLEVTKTQNTAI